MNENKNASNIVSKHFWLSIVLYHAVRVVCVMPFATTTITTTIDIFIACIDVEIDLRQATASG